MVQPETRSGVRILASVGEQAQLSPLLTLGCTLARAQGGAVTLLCVTPDGARPDWLLVPEQCSDVSVNVEVHAGQNAGKVILEVAREIDPDLLLLGWSGDPGSRRYLLGSTLDPVTQYASCDIAVVRADRLGQVRRALVPMGGGPNATLALDLALQLSPDIRVTVLTIVRESLGAMGVAVGREQLKALLEPWSDNEHLDAKVVRAPNVIDGILAEAAAGYDLMLIGASNESYIDRKLFGNVPQTLAVNAPVPTLIVRHRVGPVRSLLRQAQRWLSSVQGHITIAEQVETYREVRRGARPQVDFLVMISLAAAIAALGLLMDSPVVVIGAMLISPMMSALFGISLGVAQGDARLLWRAAGTTLRGAVLAIAIGAVAGLIVHLDEPTSEILLHAQPTLLDLVVALVSGTAGAYAQCRRNVLGALAGVAISVTLVPPLVTTGIGLTLASSTIATSAFLLFLANLSAITAAGSIVFLFFGFRPDPGKRILVFSRGIAGVLVLLIAVIALLTVLTLDSVRTIRFHRALQEALVVETEAMAGVELDEWDIVGHDETVRLKVRVWASRPVSHQEAVGLQERVASRLQRPVALVLSVTPVTQLDPLVLPDADVTNK